MDNQHRQISGYRELGPFEIDLMNDVKEHERILTDLFDKLKDDARINPRSLALAKTNLQTGFMWLVRAIARPNGE
jgi:hypothetical protein